MPAPSPSRRLSDKSITSATVSPGSVDGKRAPATPSRRLASITRASIALPRVRKSAPSRLPSGRTATNVCRLPRNQTDPRLSPTYSQLHAHDLALAMTTHLPKISQKISASHLRRQATTPASDPFPSAGIAPARFARHERLHRNQDESFLRTPARKDDDRLALPPKMLDGHSGKQDAPLSQRLCELRSSRKVSLRELHHSSRVDLPTADRMHAARAIVPEPLHEPITFRSSASSACQNDSGCSIPPSGEPNFFQNTSAARKLVSPRHRPPST